MLLLSPLIDFGFVSLLSQVAKHHQAGGCVNRDTLAIILRQRIKYWYRGKANWAVIVEAWGFFGTIAVRRVCIFTMKSRTIEFACYRKMSTLVSLPKNAAIQFTSGTETTFSK